MKNGESRDFAAPRGRESVLRDAVARKIREKVTCQFGMLKSSWCKTATKMQILAAHTVNLWLLLQPKEQQHVCLLVGTLISLRALWAQPVEVKNKERKVEKEEERKCEGGREKMVKLEIRAKAGGLSCWPVWP
eukprot:3531297-Rhodomonas_salina.4